MKENLGRTDTVIRLAVSITLLVVAAVFNSNPLIALVAAVAAVVLAASALTRRCPLYALLGLTPVSRRRPARNVGRV